MLCKQCGKEIKVTSKFCPYCDAQLSQQTPAEKNSAPAGKKPRKRRRYVVGPIVIALLLVCGGGVWALWHLTTNVRESSVADADKIEEYSNGDTVYTPSEERLAFDEDACIIYYDNLLIVYTLFDLSDSEAEALAGQVGGTIVGDISGAVNMLQIVVPGTDLETLNGYADTLMESEDVLYASFDMPMEISENAVEDNNPWTEETDSNGNITVIADKGNEGSPSGNDWWAEAIGAYTAWEYVDSNADALTDITVGILDSGFDVNHEDLTDKISVINENSEAGHGTHAAGIISAANNAIGIRGIADNATLLCADWSIETPAEDGTIDTINLLSSGEWIELTKQLVESDAKVINNSWGASLESYSELLLSLLENMEDIDYKQNSSNEWIDYTTSDEYIFQCSANMTISMLYQLCLNGYQDVLFIQAAGNGFDNGGEGYTASWNIGYSSITEERFESFMSLYSVGSVGGALAEKMESAGFNYQWIADHIIIVGAVRNEVDQDGNYYFTTFSNYGEVVDICAPGQEIYSTLTLQKDGSVYGYLSGTSMAAPMVSGAAALVWSINPSLSAGEVKDILLTNTSTHAVGVADDDAGTLYPMLNVGLAVASVTGKVGEEENGVTTDTSIYNTVLDAYYTALSEGWDMQQYRDMQQFSENGLCYLCSYADTSSVGYAFIDINGDGIEELLIGVAADTGGSIYGLYTIVDDKIVEVVYGTERSYYYLCEDYSITNHGSGGASYSYFCHYSFDGSTELSLIDAVIGDWQYDEENPWFYIEGKEKSESYFSKENYIPITDEEATEIMSLYSNAEISQIAWISFAEYTPSSSTKIIKGGTCGDNLTWTLDENGTLTISGTGDMMDYSFYDPTSPWYSSCESVISVSIENGVTSIGDFAFLDCINLKEIVISDTVTNIGVYAFNFCKSLTTVTIPDSVTNIGDAAFCGCDGLLNVTIGSNVANMGDLTSFDYFGAPPFSYCASLMKIQVSEDNSTYCDVDGVLFNKDKTELICYPAGKASSNYIIPDGVITIGRESFSKSSDLSSVSIPDSVTSIGLGAFYDCSCLTSIIIPNNVTSIGYSAFYGCTGLTNITIPDSVTNIDGYAFSGCTGLTSVTVLDGATSISGGMFFRCTGLTSVTIPDSITSIEKSAFYDCTDLSDVYYASNESDWAAISIDSENDCLTCAAIHYNCDID